ncbi:MAG: type VI secretion system baseplate subunit TssE [Nitrospira sp.]|nr:type VI secretion system baseplate subunit TssE [Nitrospira sp.]
MSSSALSLIDKIQPRDARRGIREALLWDLTALLNTRIQAKRLPEGADQIKKSILTYGLPDLTALSVVDQRDRLETLIREAIERFEPRLGLIHVERLKNNELGMAEAVQFRIEALLVVEDPPDRITFDTELQGGTVWHVTSR